MGKPEAPTFTRAVDQIRHFSARDRQSITIPEWGDLTFYFTKLTVNDWEGVSERDPKTPLERNMLLLALKAQGEDGKPVFQMGDMHALRSEADFTVVQRLITFMFQSSMPSVAAATEKLEADPTSASG